MWNWIFFIMHYLLMFVQDLPQSDAVATEIVLQLLWRDNHCVCSTLCTVTVGYDFRDNCFHLSNARKCLFFFVSFFFPSEHSTPWYTMVICVPVFRCTTVFQCSNGNIIASIKVFLLLCCGNQETQQSTKLTQCHLSKQCNKQEEIG